MWLSKNKINCIWECNLGVQLNCKQPCDAGWVELDVNNPSSNNRALCDCWEAQMKLPRGEKESVNSSVGRWEDILCSIFVNPNWLVLGVLEMLRERYKPMYASLSGRFCYLVILLLALPEKCCYISTGRAFQDCQATSVEILATHTFCVLSTEKQLKNWKPYRRARKSWGL